VLCVRRFSSASMPAEWVKAVTKELKKAPAVITRHGVQVKPIYTSADVPALDTSELPGKFPFTRGPYASMYTGRPWTVRQYAGFSTAEESNKFYREAIAAGQQGVFSKKAFVLCSTATQQQVFLWLSILRLIAATTRIILVSRETSAWRVWRWIPCSTWKDCFKESIWAKYPCR
jgi:hypothetical protein